MHSGEPDGPTKDPSSHSPALASLSARQAKALGLLTSGTCGPRRGISSASSDLRTALASRLRLRTDLLGSTLYPMTWKARATPSGRSISALRASAHRKSVKGSTSDSNPLTASAEQGAVTGWPTPTTPSGGQKAPEGTSATGRRPDGSKATVTLALVARTAGWSTPSTRGWKDTPGMSSTRSDGRSRLDQLPRQAAQAAHGETLSGSIAVMDSGARLNPHHSRWLMGISRQCHSCAPTVTASSSRKRKSSSPLTSMKKLPSEKVLLKVLEDFDPKTSRKVYLSDAIETLTAAIRAEP